MSKKVFVAGGDGFCGWPTALKLSEEGHAVTIIDNLSRRKIDVELGVDSLTPIATIFERLNTWNGSHNNKISFEQIDVVTEYQRFFNLLCKEEPDTLIHFGEQRAAPYSMKTPLTKMYTVNNNWCTVNSSTFRTNPPQRINIQHTEIYKQYTNILH